MASPIKRRATYDDLLAVPAHRVAEIVPSWAWRPGGWWILFEPELHLSGDVLVPDLAGWRRERMPQFPDTAAFTVAPDWVCEVVSPSTERLDRARKVPACAREKVAHLWLVNPLARTLEVYRLVEDQWLLLTTHGGAARVRSEPVEAVELDLAPLWAEAP